MKETFRFVAGAGLMLVGGMAAFAAVAGGLHLSGASGSGAALTALAIGVAVEGAIAYKSVFKEKAPKVS